MPEPQLDKQAWKAMHAAIWGRDWRNGEILRISGATPGRSDFGSRGFAEAGNVKALWKIIKRTAERGQQTYVQVGVQHAAARSATGRGKKSDVALLPALVVDLDINAGVHSAGDKNPTLEQALAWVDDYPLGRPTVLLHTGGGLHAWYALEEPVDPVSELGEELRARHKAWWKARASQDDRNIDAGVLADVTRVLRPAGTLNLKATPLPVTIRELTGTRYATEAFLASLPEPATKRSTKRSPKGASSSKRNDTTTTRSAGEPEEDEPPVWERFAQEYPVQLLCEDLFGAERLSSDGITMPDSDGMIPQRDAGRIFSGDDGESRVTWFSTTVQEGFGLDGQEHSHDSFQVLAYAAGGGSRGYRRATKLVAAWDGHWDSDEFVTAAAAIVCEHARAAFALVQPEIVPLPPRVECANTQPGSAPASVLPNPANEPRAESAESAPRRESAVSALLSLAEPETTASASPIASLAANPRLMDSDDEDDEGHFTRPDGREWIGGRTVVIETGGGRLRIRETPGSPAVANFFRMAQEAHSEWGRSRPVSPDLTELMTIGSERADELFEWMRDSGAHVTLSDRDSAVTGCEMQCPWPQERIDGEWMCETHRQESAPVLVDEDSI